MEKFILELKLSEIITEDGSSIYIKKCYEVSDFESLVDILTQSCKEMREFIQNKLHNELMKNSER